jgi:hypothetical protein
MSRIRITGLVALANCVRRTLAGPASAQDVARLREGVARNLRAVDQILAEHRTRPQDLPPQSRKAYQFLKGIDFDRVPVGEAAAGAPGAGGEVRFGGLRRFLESALDDLAEARREGVGPVSARIVTSSRNLEDEIVRTGLRPEQLTAETRQIRGWLAFFSDRANLEAYLGAVERARPVFEKALGDAGRHPLPAMIHFRPMRGLARVRIFRDGTRIAMPTPMMCFTSGQFDALAGLLLRHARDKRSIIEAMAAKAYQDVQAELEALGGVVELTAGMAHDLAAAFARVNQACFGGTMDRPRLTWSRALTSRKFGHYDRASDTVMVSSTLDHASVPEFVVDFIVYHELLHKKHGIDWRSGQARAHTAAFREEERRFARHAEAEAILKGLAKGTNL